MIWWGVDIILADCHKENGDDEYIGHNFALQQATNDNY